MRFSTFNLSGFALCLMMFFYSCDTETADTDLQSNSLTIQNAQLDITWKLNSNIADDAHFNAVLTLSNHSDDVFPGGGWALYLNSVRPLVPESFLPGLMVTHINGDFFKLEPTADFEPIPPGEEREIEYSGEFFFNQKNGRATGVLSRF